MEFIVAEMWNFRSAVGKTPRRIVAAQQRNGQVSA
jgi:hypothetical protein